MLILIFSTGIYVQYHRFNQIQTDKMCFQLIGRATVPVILQICQFITFYRILYTKNDR